MTVSNIGNLLFIDEIMNEDHSNILHNNLLSFVILQLLCQKDQGFKIHSSYCKKTVK